jgi:hypothetical protein
MAGSCNEGERKRNTQRRKKDREREREKTRIQHSFEKRKNIEREKTSTAHIDEVVCVRAVLIVSTFVLRYSLPIMYLQPANQQTSTCSMQDMIASLLIEKCSLEVGDRTAWRANVQPSTSLCPFRTSIVCRRHRTRRSTPKRWAVLSFRRTRSAWHPFLLTVSSRPPTIPVKQVHNATKRNSAVPITKLASVNTAINVNLLMVTTKSVR